jgi:hypothetical protein
LPRDNQGETRIASSRNAPGRQAVASPRCSRRVGALSIGLGSIRLESQSMVAAFMLNLGKQFDRGPVDFRSRLVTADVAVTFVKVVVPTSRRDLAGPGLSCGSATRLQVGAGPHHRARSSASPPVPRGDRNRVISGLQISRGYGGLQPGSLVTL